MWDFTNDRPIYIQLIEQMEMNIVNGTYTSGDKLPSVRDLATEVGANPNTVQRAFAELERSGIINTQRTNGRFITEDTEMISKMRNELAMEQVRQFVKKMKDFGYKLEDIAELIKNSEDAKEEE